MTTSSATVADAVPAALAPLQRARRLLGVVLVARAALGGLAVALAILAAARIASLAGVATPAWNVALAVAAGTCVAIAMRARDGRLTDRRVALWAEERTPGVDYALVTAADPRHAGLVPALAPAIARIPWSALVGTAARRALLPVAALCTVTVVALLAVPAASRALTGARVDGSTTAAADRASGAPAGTGTATTPGIESSSSATPKIQMSAWRARA